MRSFRWCHVSKLFAVLLLPLCSGCKEMAQVSVPVTFNDAALEHAVKAALRLPDDTVLTSDLMLELTDLAIWEYGTDVSDLTGLEYAFNLDWLDISGGHIRSLAPIERLPRLQTLRLGGCPLDESGTFSNWPALEELWLVGTRAQQFKVIDMPKLRTVWNKNRSGPGTDETISVEVIGCPVLEEVMMEDYGATALIVEDCASLRKLDIGGLPLIGVRLSNLPALKSLSLTEGALSYIDLSGLTSLTGLNLRGNQLMAIDLEPVPLLKFLILSGNNFSEIDLSPVPDLKNLQLGGNPLNAINLEGNPLLSELYLQDTTLTSLDLTHQAYLTRLDLTSSPVGEVNLDSNPELQYLFLDDTEISTLNHAAGLEHVIALLARRNQIEYLTPLFAWPNLADAYIDVTQNPLSLESLCEEIPEMRALGTRVIVSGQEWCR
ncbi:MAG: hypothetical protein GC168_07530 [Candidatus Hydrogenedens sp.]|nr:hypothetical protein [Candidatus Hydrogenedens sp.]